MFESPFHWWVQSVMPVVFDDSLSYYEVLAKLTKYTEGLTNDVSQIESILETIEGIQDISEFTRFLESIQAQIGTLANLSTTNKSDLVSAINEVAQKANNAYVKPSTGIPENDLSADVQTKLNQHGSGGGSIEYIINNVKLFPAPTNNTPSDLGLGTYTVPDGGIPWQTLSEDVRRRIDAGGSGSGGTDDYTELINKPQINGHTLNAGNNSGSSLGLGTYSKPADGIPESDLSDLVQSKLNASSSIADVNDGFVAQKDYDIGELVYIDSVLYKVTVRTLQGSDFVVGNNIVATDINDELQEINGKIDEMASGQGLDSWSLSAILRGMGVAVEQKFFEYIRCTGGEDYLFIVNRSLYSANFVLKIYARDGTLVDTQTAGTSYNDYRFTFTPEDTGDYYCALLMTPVAGDNYYITVTVEYTQSQGITALWDAVNAASSVVEDVDALETLVDTLRDDVDTKANYVNLATIQYKNNRIYTKGEFCFQEGKLYRSNQNIMTFEEFTAAHWDETMIDQEIAPLSFDDYIIPGVSGGINEDGSSTTSSSRSRTMYLHLLTGDMIIFPLAANVLSFTIFLYYDGGDGVHEAFTFDKKANAEGTWDNRKTPFIAPYDCFVRVLEQKAVANWVPLLLRRSVPAKLNRLSDINRFDELIDSARTIQYNVDSNGQIEESATGNRRASKFIFLNAGDRIYDDNDTLNRDWIHIYNLDGSYVGSYFHTWTNFGKERFYEADKPQFVRIAEKTDDANHTWYNFHIIRNSEQRINELNWKNVHFLDIAHQGFRDEAPASTKAAYVRAKIKGYNAMEGDIRYTSDGEAVIIHNAGMPSDSSYLVAEHTLAELRANANMGTYRGEAEPIITFDEYLQLAKELDMTPFIEFKVDPTGEQLEAAVEACIHHGLIDRMYWMCSSSSGSAIYANNFLSVSPRCRLAFINTTNVNTVAAYVDNTDYNKVIIYTRTENVNSTLVNAAHEAGIPVHTWAVTFTWQYPDLTMAQIMEEIYRVLDLGVDGICMDNWCASELIRLRYAKYLDCNATSNDPA